MQTKVVMHLDWDQMEKINQGGMKVPWQMNCTKPG